jgi:FlaA1/EpsC-like NDP-sugar epimerase
MKKRSNWRGSLAFAHDVCAAALAWAALCWLGFNLDFKESYLQDMGSTLTWILPLQAGIFLALGLYRGLWRFASIVDLQRIVFAAGLGAILIPVVLVMLKLQAVVPRSVLVFYPVVLIFLMTGSRFAYRIWKEHRLYSPLEALGEPVLIIGAGEAGARLAKDLTRSRQWRVVGLLDDDRAKQGRLLRNVSVLGPSRSSRPG